MLVLVKRSLTAYEQVMSEKHKEICWLKSRIEQINDIRYSLNSDTSAIELKIDGPRWSGIVRLNERLKQQIVQDLTKGLDMDVKILQSQIDILEQ